MKRHRVEDGLNIVVPVRPLSDDIQPQVYLAVWKKYHVLIDLRRWSKVVNFINPDSLRWQRPDHSSGNRSGRENAGLVTKLLSVRVSKNNFRSWS